MNTSTHTEVVRRAKVIGDSRGRRMNLIKKQVGYELVDEYTVPQVQLRVAEFRSDLVNAWHLFDEKTSGQEWEEADPQTP